MVKLKKFYVGCFDLVGLPQLQWSEHHLVYMYTEE